MSCDGALLLCWELNRVKIFYFLRCQTISDKSEICLLTTVPSVVLISYDESHTFTDLRSCLVTSKLESPSNFMNNRTIFACAVSRGVVDVQLVPSVATQIVLLRTVPRTRLPSESCIKSLSIESAFIRFSLPYCDCFNSLRSGSAVSRIRFLTASAESVPSLAHMRPAASA